MSSHDQESECICRECGNPIQKGWIGTVTEKCLSCARVEASIDVLSAASATLKPTAQGSNARARSPSEDLVTGALAMWKPSMQGIQIEEPGVSTASQAVQFEAEENAGGEKLGEVPTGSGTIKTTKSSRKVPGHLSTL